MMPRIKTDQPEFEKLLDDFNSINETLVIKDRDIHLRNTVKIDVFNKSYKFENCIIKGGRIDFFDFHFKDESKQNFYSVEFKNCEISSDLFLKDCKLHTLSFTNVKVDANHFHISSSEILYIRFNSQATKRTEIKNLPTHHWAKFEQILSEFLKFIFSFGFTSPGFQSNGFLFLIFIIEKIFIGFGIYQTIAAFRKFK